MMVKGTLKTHTKTYRNQFYKVSDILKQQLLKAKSINMNKTHLLLTGHTLAQTT